MVDTAANDVFMAQLLQLVDNKRHWAYTTVVNRNNRSPLCLIAYATDAKEFCAFCRFHVRMISVNVHVFYASLR